MRCEERLKFAYVSVRYIMYPCAYLWPASVAVAVAVCSRWWCCCSSQVQKKIFFNALGRAYSKLENVAAGKAARCIHARNQIVITASTSTATGSSSSSRNSNNCSSNTATPATTISSLLLLLLSGNTCCTNAIHAAAVAAAVYLHLLAAYSGHCLSATAALLQIQNGTISTD